MDDAMARSYDGSPRDFRVRTCDLCSYSPRSFSNYLHKMSQR